MKRRIRMLALSLIPVFCLGLVNLSFSDDAIRLESWRERAHEGNFAQGIAGVYLIRHHTDEGTPGSFRLISLTAGGNWASTHSGQHAIVNFPGVPFLSEDSGNEHPQRRQPVSPRRFFRSVHPLQPVPLQRPARGVGAVGLAGNYGGGGRFQPRRLDWSAYRYRARPLCGAIQQRFTVCHRYAEGAGLSA